MAVYVRFEDLPIWKLAKDLAVKIYQITKDEKFRRDYSLADQIRRASISVSSNIAEGFERGSKKEFIKFLYIAKGSLGEMRSQLQISFELSYINKEKLNTLLTQSHDLSNQLGAFIASIKKRIRS
jgi:four helix bundle protein